VQVESAFGGVTCAPSAPVTSDALATAESSNDFIISPISGSVE